LLSPNVSTTTIKQPRDDTKTTNKLPQNNNQTQSYLLKHKVTFYTQSYLL
jgi:hypothetical protein